MNKTNLTNPYEIVAAIKKKAGLGGVSVCAEETGYKVPYISQHIHKRRNSLHVRQAIANWLGCGVHGVLPDDQTRPEAAKEGKG